VVSHQNGALSFPVLSDGHELVQMLATFYFELDPDQGVTEVIE
jgi:hypothetical protein